MRFVLDTNAVIYLQRGQIAEPLPVGESSISVITEMELLSFAGLSEEQGAWLRRFIDAIAIVELDGDVKQRAIELRRDVRLKLPDAIIVASALARDADLVSNDGQLARVPGLRLRSLPLRDIP